MMRCKNGVLLLSLAALACSGRYEVGEMDPAGGGSTSSSGTSAGGGGREQGVGNAGPGGAAGANCFNAVAPVALSVPFVAPSVVWERLSTMIWGEAHAAPHEPPAQTTYAWAGQLVDDAFGQALAEVGGVPGGTFFVRQWLGLASSTATLEGDYESRLAPDDNVLLEVLLQTSWAPGHAGVFSEKAWLAGKPGTPTRGREMAEAVFGISIPAPPAGVDLSVDATLPDRAALEAVIAAPSCASCHRMFTPLGFALLHFDRDGDYRDLDHNMPIDATGSFPLQDGTMEFDGIAELGAKAATTCDANLAIVDRFLEVALTARGYDPATRDTAIDANRERVQRAFIASGRSYHALVRAFAQSPLVLY